MNPEFWHDKWHKQQLGFHLDEVNPLLVSHIHALNLKKQDCVFVPLCGKTRDIAWLLSQGFKVIGIELVELAVEQLFDELGVMPTIKKHDQLTQYTYDALTVFVGDVFELTAEMLGAVSAVYDRAAFVALPSDMRLRYSDHVTTISDNAQQLLINYAYDQAVMAGPPFASTEQDIAEHYGECYQLNILLKQALDGGLKGVPATEYVWHLTPSPAS